MISKRQFAIGSGALTMSPLLGLRPGKADDPTARLTQAFAEIEKRSGGRLGVSVFDSQTGLSAGHRADERFAMCSTFKLLLTATVLQRIDAKKLDGEKRIRFAASDLLSYSPGTKAQAGGDGMTPAELCEATMTLSDNTAANLLLKEIGGPTAVTAFARSLGDQVSRLDRIEPDLNEAQPGDPRDTTSPSAMLWDVRALTRAGALSGPSAGQLVDWLVGCKTGDARLRAGLPKDWRAGDKTGTGENGSTNDVGLFWPRGRGAIYITAYLAESPAPIAQRESTLAAVARVVADAVTAG